MPKTSAVLKPAVLATTALATALAAALLGAPAGAIVPPRDCHTIKASHKHWHIKADQIACTKAKSYAKSYIVHHKKPSGYHCTKFHGSSLYAKCVNTKTNPDRTIFIIKS